MNLKQKRILKISIQALVAFTIVALLVWVGIQNDVAGTLKKVDFRYVLLGFGVMVIASAVNALRWKILLHNVQIDRSLPGLTVLYFIGFFFSQMLPSGTGGDAVRIYDVSKRSGRIAGAIMATLQERFLGVGIAMFIGLFATIYYWASLPPAWRIWILLPQAAAPLGMLVALYPHVWVDTVLKLTGAKLGAKVRKIIDPILRLPRIPPLTLALASLVTAVGVTMSISVYWILARTMQIDVPLGGFLLIVPLVWIVRMAGIFGGLGFGEASLAGLLFLLFNIPKGEGIALGAVYLVITLSQALLGGVLLAIKVAAGTWIPVRDAEKELAAAEPGTRLQTAE